MRYGFGKTLAALGFAVFAMLATPTAARADLIIHFDQTVAEGGTVLADGTGEDIVFDLITLEDNGTILASAQCGLDASEACLLDFNTNTGFFQLTAPNGLYDAGPDNAAYTADTGAEIGTNESLILDGNITQVVAYTSVAAVLQGVDTKNAALLDFFNIDATNFKFLNSELYFSGFGQDNVDEADLINSVPEPGLLMMFGLGLLGVGRRLAVRNRG
jgi:hypothetical protein